MEAYAIFTIPLKAYVYVQSWGRFSTLSGKFFAFLYSLSTVEVVASEVSVVVEDVGSVASSCPEIASMVVSPRSRDRGVKLCNPQLIYPKEKRPDLLCPGRFSCGLLKIRSELTVSDARKTIQSKKESASLSESKVHPLMLGLLPDKVMPKHFSGQATSTKTPPANSNSIPHVASPVNSTVTISIGIAKVPGNNSYQEQLVPPRIKLCMRPRWPGEIGLSQT